MSPIAGLTDRGAALARIGTLRKGGPKSNDKQPGPDLSYFRFVTDPELADVAATFKDEYGDKPTKINIFLLFDEVSDNFEAWQEKHVAGGLMHRCDGKTAVLWRDKDGNMRTEPIPCPDIGKPKDDRERCKPVGRLSVLVPELGRIATVTVVTSSVHDIMSIQESLEAAKFLQKGKLAGIPFILTRREREISTPSGNGKRARRKKSLLFIEPAHHYAIAALKAMDITPLLVSAPSTPPAPDDYDDEMIDTETGEIIAPIEEVKPPAKPRRDIQAGGAAIANGAENVWPEIPTFARIGDFYKWCLDNFHIMQPAVNKNLNIKAATQLGDLVEAATTIRAIYRTKPAEVESADDPPPDDEPIFSEEEQAP